MKSKLLITILSILLILSVSFIAITQINSYREKQLTLQNNIYKKGRQDGYELAVMQLMEELTECKPVPLYFENITLNAVSLECLQE